MVEVISIHIPKTAGTAFLQVLRDVYQDQALIEDYPPDRIYDPQTDTVASNIKVIHGHFTPANKYDLIFPDAHKIVWLRHPVFRLISEYCFAQKIKDTNNPIHCELIKNNLNLLEFAALPNMRNIQSLYIEGLSVSDFSFIGIQEFYAEDIKDLSQIMGWTPVISIAENANPYPQYQAYVSEVLNDADLVNQLALLNDADMELYHQALQKRATRRQDSSYVQSTLAEWQRSQLLLNQANAEVASLNTLVDICFKPIQNVKFIQNENETSQAFEFNVDCEDNNRLPVVANKIGVYGWFVGKTSEVRFIRALCDENIIHQSPVDRPRPDVAAFLEAPQHKYSGFEFTLLSAYLTHFRWIKLEAVLANGDTVTLGKLYRAQHQKSTPKANDKGIAAIKKFLTGRSS